MTAKSKSQILYRESVRLMPGGVSSPVRAFKAVGGNPIFISQAKGPFLLDEDGQKYLDYVCCWGALILGHAYPSVIKAVKASIDRGTGYGAPTRLELELAQLISSALPSVEMIRFVNSGTEAVMSAVRLARAATGRDIIVKFTGCYHGHSDSMLVKPGSGVATLGIPGSSGVPDVIASRTISAAYNNSLELNEIFSKYGKLIAAVIVEPVAANMGLVLPEPGFLARIRQLCSVHQSILIFDEVITGFRVGYGGAQAYYGIDPDLTCLGKIIGGGFPVGAYGGKKEIMKLVAPVGSVYQAGTLAGNPIAMTAGIETLKILKGTDIYQALEVKANYLVAGIKKASIEADVNTEINKLSSMFSIFFNRGRVKDFKSADRSSTRMFSEFFRELISRGVYFPPSQFETCFMSLAHQKTHLDFTINSCVESFVTMKKKECID